jgi:hypothetical protein
LTSPFSALTALDVKPSEFFSEFSSFDCSKALLMLDDFTEIIPNDKKRSRKKGTKKWKFNVQNFDLILGKSSLKPVVLEAK